MTSNVSFRAVLGTPKAGWLPITLDLGTKSYEVVASGVLNDPMNELVDAVLFLSGTSSGEANVRAWEEPGMTEFRFVADSISPNVTIEVREVSDWRGTADRLDRPCRHSGVFKRKHVAMVLIDALRAFERRLPPTGAIGGWGTLDVDKLRRVVQRRDE